MNDNLAVSFLNYLFHNVNVGLNKDGDEVVVSLRDIDLYNETQNNDDENNVFSLVEYYG